MSNLSLAYILYWNQLKTSITEANEKHQTAQSSYLACFATTSGNAFTSSIKAITDVLDNFTGDSKDTEEILTGYCKDLDNAKPFNLTATSIPKVSHQALHNCWKLYRDSYAHLTTAVSDAIAFFQEPSLIVPPQTGGESVLPLNRYPLKDRSHSKILTGMRTELCRNWCFDSITTYLERCKGAPAASSMVTEAIDYNVQMICLSNNIKNNSPLAQKTDEGGLVRALSQEDFQRLSGMIADFEPKITSIVETVMRNGTAQERDYARLLGDTNTCLRSWQEFLGSRVEKSGGFLNSNTNATD